MGFGCLNLLPRSPIFWYTFLQGEMFRHPVLCKLGQHFLFVLCYSAFFARNREWHFTEDAIKKDVTYNSTKFLPFSEPTSAMTKHLHRILTKQILSSKSLHVNPLYAAHVVTIDCTCAYFAFCKCDCTHAATLSCLNFKETSSLQPCRDAMSQNSLFFSSR